MSNERGNGQSYNQLGAMVRQAYEDSRLSPDQRHVHMRRLGIRGPQQEFVTNRRRRRGGVLELAAVLLILAAIVAGVLVWNSERTGQNRNRAASGVSTPTASPTSSVSHTALEQALRPLIPGGGRHIVMSVSTDYRLDESSVLRWNADIWERIRADGTHQLRMTARSQSGEVIGRFVENGDQWEWNQRGWIEKGNVNSGIAQLPEEMRIVNQELHVLPALFNQRVSGSSATPNAAGIVTISISSPDVGSIGQQLGIDAVGSSQQIRLQATPDQVVDAQTLLTTRTGNTISLGTYTFSEASTMQSAAIRDAEFDISTGASAESTHYTIPDALPFGLKATSHAEITRAAEVQYTLNRDSLSIRLSVYPSRGGVDARAWKRLSGSGTSFHTINSKVGEVDWTSKSNSQTPQQAIWDTGRFRFELTATSISTTSGWNASQLAGLVDALSRKESK